MTYAAAAIWALVVWRACVVPFWPWDWRGNRKAITLKRRGHDWEDGDDD